MRWVTFKQSGQPVQVGLVHGDVVVAVPGVSSLLDLLKSGHDHMQAKGEDALAARSDVRTIGDVEFLAPIPTPPSIRDFMSFEQHVAAGAKARGRTVQDDWYKLPVFYFTNPYAVVGPTADVPMPPGTQRFDFEVEVAVVIARPGYNLAPDEAEGYVAGYTILNDWSARDVQFREMKVGLGPAKGKDTATTLGPMLVTPDELEHLWSGRHYDIQMKVSVNDREYGTDSLTNMYWTFGELISYASRGTWVMPGDVIGSGTFGCGCLVELSGASGEDEFPWLRIGDEVSIEMTELGRISNRIIKGSDLIPLRHIGQI